MNPGYQSPYPRNNAFRTPRREIDISAIGEAWGIVSKNLVPFVLAGLAILVVQQGLGQMGNLLGTGLTAGMTRNPDTVMTGFIVQLGVAMPFSILGAALSAIIAGSVVLMALKAVRGGTPEVGDIALGFTTNPIGLLVAGFLVGLGTTLGSVLCIIPGLVLAGLWFVTTPFMLDRGLGPIEAMAASWNAMKDNMVMAAVIALLAGLVSFLGVCACGFGVLVTIPLLYVTQAIIYEDLTADDQPGSFAGGTYPTDPFSAYSTPPAPGEADPFASSQAPPPPSAAPEEPSAPQPAPEPAPEPEPAQPEAPSAPETPSGTAENGPEDRPAGPWTTPG